MDLEAAIKNNDIEAIQQFLQDADVNPNRSSESGFAPLHDACFFGRPDIVKCLINDPRVDVNNADNGKGKTPFNIACEKGETEVVKLLLHDERVDINKQTHFTRRTPLIHASMFGHTECVEYILASGREVNLTSKNQEGGTAMDVARASKNPDIVKLFELFEKNPNRTRTELREKLGLLGILFSFSF